VGLEGFWLLFSSIITIIKGIYIFLSVASNYRYTKVFKLLVHLGIRAHSAILPRGLYCRNLLLLEGPSCLSIIAFYKVFIEFLFRLSQNFKGEWWI